MNRIFTKSHPPLTKLNWSSPWTLSPAFQGNVTVILCSSMTRHTRSLHFYSIAIWLLWCCYGDTLLTALCSFGALSEESVMKWSGHRIFLGLFPYTNAEQHDFPLPGNVCIKHELKMMKNNLHWLDKKCECFSFCTDLTRNILFLLPVPGDVTPRDSGSSGFSVECNTPWVLGQLTLLGERPCERGVRMTGRKRTYVFEHLPVST